MTQHLELVTDSIPESAEYAIFEAAIEEDFKRIQDPDYVLALQASALAVVTFLGQLEDSQATTAQRLRYQKYVG